jgi:hypothetical protein
MGNKSLQKIKKFALETRLAITNKGKRIIGERNENMKILKKETMMM